MNKIKLLFLHFDLGNGGAENVLVNLINALDKSKYDITLRTVFSGGVNKDRLCKDIDFKPLFNCKAIPGTSKLFKILPTWLLRKFFINGIYDCEIAFLEEIPTRILGCIPKRPGTRRYSWFHNTVDDHSFPFRVFRSEKEFYKVYSTMDKIAFVSKGSLESFEKELKVDVIKEVVHNACDFEKMKTMSKELINPNISPDIINLCSVGRLCGQKGFHRLIKALGSIKSRGLNNWHLYLIGDGPAKESLIELTASNDLNENISFVGFQSNPYKYVSKMDFFVCSSYKEGYSTAVTESIVVGTPVLTTNCSGMDEIIGDSGAGIIVDNTQNGIESGLWHVLNLGKKEIGEYKTHALLHSNNFSLDSRVAEFEQFIGTI